MTDSYPRLYAEQLIAKFGIQAIVENKPGAGAIIAINACGCTWRAGNYKWRLGVTSYQSFAAVQPRGVKAIGVTGSCRSAKLPDVPTLTEQGTEGRLVTLKGGLPLMAPACTP